MDNVIRFPVEKRLAKVNEKEQALDEMTQDIATDVVQYLLDEGMSIEDEKHIFHVSLFYESLRSMIFWLNGSYHPIQNLATEIYENVVFENEDQLELF